MTQDEIIELAKEAGMEQDLDMWFSPSYEYCDVHILELERFAKLVAEKEREICATLVDENAKKCSKDSKAQMILYSNATAIRARGQA